jgi:hypothetical protein
VRTRKNKTPTIRGRSKISSLGINAVAVAILQKKKTLRRNGGYKPKPTAYEKFFTSSIRTVCTQTRRRINIL